MTFLIRCPISALFLPPRIVETSNIMLVFSNLLKFITQIQFLRDSPLTYIWLGRFIELIFFLSIRPTSLILDPRYTLGLDETAKDN